MAGVPSAMLFVRSDAGGVSHAPEECTGGRRDRLVPAGARARAARAGGRVIDWDAPRAAVAARPRALRPGPEPGRAQAASTACRARAAELERGPVRAARATCSRPPRPRLRNAAFYPERAFADFRAAVAAWLGVPPSSVIPAHGAQALIGSIAPVFVDPGHARRRAAPDLRPVPPGLLPPFGAAITRRARA